MTSFNLTSLSLSYNETTFSNNSNSNDDTKSIVYYELELNVLFVLIIIICILGCWGTGNVIWLLGFCIKRSPFTVYILNLAIADFGLLTVELIIEVVWAVGGLKESLLHVFLGDVFQFMYNAGQFLLTAISLDRCVSVLFPLWYRYHRPPYLPTVVCALIWMFSFLLPGIHFIVCLTFKGKQDLIKYYQYTFNGFFCLPLMTISTLILFIKVCFKSQQRKRGKLLMVILLTLFFFIFFSFPMNAYYMIIYIFHSPAPYSLPYCYLSTALNSSVNPLIYFLIGRQKRGTPRESMEARLQNVFKEEENSTK
ncbi:mas-related G-protein coupled receptor member H-like [Podarcis raffonei]|uniref:mas-related G-protein coupled receptor member H-like n=1 Tax=Podarcis raffonei TaxID=65483 RepID=UPI0023291F80|nr:mas-related G-protein coupled receptor member H-like [Podarcis raffonei]